MAEEVKEAPSGTFGVLLIGKLMEVRPAEDYKDKETGEVKRGQLRVTVWLGGSQVATVGFKDERRAHELVGQKPIMSEVRIPVRVPFAGAEFSGYWSAS